MILFNVPLDATEADVRQFVEGAGVQVQSVEVTCCKLNMNSSATVTVQGDAE